jgi:purine-binding chemotaxis protein CheW
MQVQLIGFRVGDQLYAMDILSVVQIIPLRKPVRVARAPEFVEGVIHLRGMVVPVVDLRRRFGVESESPAPAAKAGEGAEEALPGRVLIVRAGTAGGTEQHIGLVADAATQVIRTEREKFLRAPDVLLKDDSAYTGDVYQDAEERMYMVLDPAKILTPRERRALDGLAETGPAAA